MHLKDPSGMITRPHVAILGAGPAGLGAAHRLARRGSLEVTVIERGATVGGNAGSFEFGELRVDYGSHRLHPSCAPEILHDIRQMLGEELLDRPRHGRIRLRGRWVHFPLKPADLVMQLPPSFLAGVGADALWKPFRRGRNDTFAAVLRQGLGQTICRDFYFPYARKIWGVDPETLDAEQARRRVSAGSMLKMARKALNAIPGLNKKRSGHFYYPKRGYGAISEAYAEAATAQGARLKLQTAVSALQVVGGRVCAIHTAGPAGNDSFEIRQALSTIPLPQLIRLIQPQAPDRVLGAACALKFRSMILIYLLLDTEQFTEFDAHYFPEVEIAITRLSEPKNYGLADLPGRTVLCAELPCWVEDPLWRASDAELSQWVVDALAAAGLPVRCRVFETASRRLSQAYPIYHRGYETHFRSMDEWVNGIEGLVTFGRQGLFAHDNTHHALAMAYALDECIRDDASLDRDRWAHCRQAFRKHVVED
jgi:protoporphyrinogen oxidase